MTCIGLSVKRNNQTLSHLFQFSSSRISREYNMLEITNRKNMLKDGGNCYWLKLHSTDPSETIGGMQAMVISLEVGSVLTISWQAWGCEVTAPITEQIPAAVLKSRNASLDCSVSYNWVLLLESPSDVPINMGILVFFILKLQVPCLYIKQGTFTS